LRIDEAVRNLALEFCEKAGLKGGDTVIVGCSTSEIGGHRIGSHSNAEIGAVVFNELFDIFSKRGVHLAAQCCEHLNRAIIVPREISEGFNIVNVIPATDAGGAFASAAYKGFDDPVALESFSADAGIDIGGTLIGMHLKRVAVPLRLEIKHIGEAVVIAARTRPPLIGGGRAKYDEGLM
jgi:uncharacterized protein (TIGR01440 family)